MQGQSKSIKRVFLGPGDFHFGDRETRIVTLLGSCVSITLWHPRLLVGGMCHFMLPTRRRSGQNASLAELDGRYGDEAMALFLNEVRRLKAMPGEFQAKLFGGANMFPRLTSSDRPIGVGAQNVEVGVRLLEEQRIPLVARHLGGESHRKLMFDVWSGDVWLNAQNEEVGR